MKISEAMRPYIIFLSSGKIGESTVDRYESIAKSFIEKTGDKELAAVDEVDFMSYFAGMKKAGKSPSYVALHYAALCNFIHYLNKFHQYRNCTPSDFKGRRPLIPERLPKAIESWQVQMILEQCENVEDEFLITMLFHTGLRIAELLGLTKSSFDFNERRGEGGEIVRQRWVTVIGKRNKQRDVPLDKTVCEVIDRLFAFKDMKYPRGWSKIMDTGYWPIYKRIGELAKKAGLEKHITPHTFRHSFATALRNNDQPIDIIQQLLGHADIATTMIYVKAKNEKKVDAVNTLDERGGQS